MNFTHLHVHSHYSILDGMSKIPDLVLTAQSMGMNAIALTDHGNMFGIKELLDFCKKHNGKPKAKVKEYKENIEKAEALVKQIPALQEQLKASTDKSEQAAIKVRLQDADKAQKALPVYEEELVKLQQKADEYKPFKPIVGIEAYCARRGRKFKDKNIRQRNGYGKEQIVDRSGWHLILLAKNITGYHNLCVLSSLAYIDGFYDRPRLDKELLEKYHEGVICSSACLGGELCQLIMEGKTAEAEESARWFKSVFGDDYYIELMRHKTDKPGGDTLVYEMQKKVNPILIDIAKRNDIKVICTNDVHFVKEEHGEAHDHLICISTGAYIEDDKRMHYTKQEWLKSPEQMAEIFADIPEALENTQEIADKVEVYDIDSAPIMPKFPIPEDFGTEEQYRQNLTPEQLIQEFTTDENGKEIMSQEAAEKKVKKMGGVDKLYRIKLEADYLAKLTWEGAKKRYGENLTDEIKDRIRFELHIMKTMGFPGYFLIVYDYIRAAREELGVSVGPGRGSAAGSVVAYCLRITDVDPIPYDLLFERFLNPDRISLPDIDVDFDDAGREKVLDWVTQKYGFTHVAHIITYGAMATKSSIADVGRVEKVPLSVVNEIKKMVPDRFPDDIKDEKGKTPAINLTNCFRYLPSFKEKLSEDDPKIVSMLRYAEQLENTNRQIGIHACGVIIGADDLTKFAPLATVKDKETEKDVIVTQYDGHVVESVGLIKMDFLGLKTLTIIKEALKNIKKSYGVEVDIDHIPIDDPLTYKLYQEGRTIGTFQFESAGMRKYLRELKPTVFSDLIAMNALYRPGPMDYIPQFIRRKNGQEKITYDLPCMDTYLKDTYGVTVYQEQVMLLSRLLAGFTRGESDTLRKAMGKKQIATLEMLHPKFIEGGKKNGHDPKILDKIWTDWQAFAKYAFNKSHATCYAWVAYQTAYLKAHYPACLMAADLTVSMNDITSVGKFLDECKDIGIKVLQPDVNESELTFTANKDGNIRFGLGGIKGVGQSASETIIREREANGPYKSIYDFVERINLQAVNRKTIESLAYAGAFDSLDLYREQLLSDNSKGESVLDMLIRYGNTFQQESANQQNSLFGMFGGDLAVEIKKPELPQVERWSTLERLNKEKEAITIFLSAHPLDDYGFVMNTICNFSTKDLNLLEQIKSPELRQNYSPEEGEPTAEGWLTEKDGKDVCLGGIITKLEMGTTRSGKTLCRYTIEDYKGSYNGIMWEEQYKQFAAYMNVNNYIYLRGRVQQRFADSTKFRFTPKPMDKAEFEFAIRQAGYLEELQNEQVQQLTVSIPIDRITTDMADTLEEFAKKYQGNTKLVIMILDEVHHNNLTFESRLGGITISKEIYNFLKQEQENENLYWTI